ncbi:MAG: response regulator [Candidatus Nomurabacteria bacterium]|nr:response regulator [Candidatus Nomurabacteria bacterium]
MPDTQKSILIAEDEKAIGHALELKLTAAGFNVVMAGNGAEAQKHLSQQTFDLILTDLVMPEMDGFTLLQWMKDNNITTQTMVLTNLSQETDREKATAFGAIGFFVKSEVPIATIVEEVQKVLA